VKSYKIIIIILSVLISIPLLLVISFFVLIKLGEVNISDLKNSFEKISRGSHVCILKIWI
jgi:hypothetical protein